MPHKAKRPCRYRGCPKLVDDVSGYCPEHSKKISRNYDKFLRSPEHNKRYDYRWRKIRKKFLEANPLCERCKKAGRYTLAVEIHHIKPLAEGGTHDLSNLMALCRSCHAQVHGAKRQVKE